MARMRTKRETKVFEGRRRKKKNKKDTREREKPQRDLGKNKGDNE